MDLGTLSWNVDVDTRDLERAERDMEGVRGAATGAEKSTDRLGTSAERAGRRTRTATQEMERGFSGARTAARALVGVMAAIGVSAGLGQAVRQIADFQGAMNGLAAVSGATAEQMEQLEQQARSLGATSQFSAQQAAEGQRFLAQAGFEANEIMSATPGILKLATAGQLDLASAADIASNVLGGMRLEVDQLNRVNDVLAATAARSNTNIQQLGQALSFAAPFAAGAGVSIEEAAAAIGVMSDAGIQASRAGTGLVGTIRQLSKVTGDGEDVLARYGLSIADVNIEGRGLEPVLETLREANLNTADAIALFGSEAGAAAQVLVQDYQGGIKDATGEAERMANQLEQGLGPAFRSLGSAVSESVLQLGDSGLAGALEGLISTTTGVVSVWNGMGDAWAENNKVGEKTLGIIKGLANALAIMAAMAGARAVQAIGSLIIGMTGMTGASITLTGALTGLRTVMMTLFGPVGLIAGAVTALFLFREELGFVEGAAYNTEKALRANEDAIRDGSQAALDSSYEGLVLELENVSLKAQEAMERMLQLNRMTDFYADSHLGMAKIVSQQAEEQETLLADLWDSMVEIQAAQERNRQKREALTTAENDGVETGNRLTDTIDGTSSATNKFAQSLQALEDRLYPAEASQREFLQSQILLQTALMNGTITIDRYFESIERLEESTRNASSAAEVYGLNIDSTTEAANDAQGAARDLGFAFESAFESAILEGESFRDVLDGIFNDIIRIALRTGVTNPLGEAIGGIDFGGIFSGMFGGGGGAGTFSGGSGGSLFGGGRRNGGPVSSGSIYEVNEGGAPEMLQQNGRQYLLPGANGNVVPFAPSGGGNGGGVEVNVYAPEGSSVQTQERQNSNGGKSIDVMIDEATAQNINTPGSRTSRAMQQKFGTQNVLTGR